MEGGNKEEIFLDNNNSLAINASGRPTMDLQYEKVEEEKEIKKEDEKKRGYEIRKNRIFLLWNSYSCNIFLIKFHKWYALDNICSLCCKIWKILPFN